MKLRHAATLARYLYVAFWVFALSASGQLFAQREAAEASVWGFAPGWQREIGFFDISIALLCFSASRSDDIKFQRGLVLAIVILAMLVGTNHLSTVLSGRTGTLHTVFTVINYALVAGGVTALVVQKRWSMAPGPHDAK